MYLLQQVATNPLDQQILDFLSLDAVKVLGIVTICCGGVIFLACIAGLFMSRYKANSERTSHKILWRISHLGCFGITILVFLVIIGMFSLTFWIAANETPIPHYDPPPTNVFPSP